MDGLVVTQKDIEEYLNQRSGLTENTRSTYRARLNQLYDLLPQDKTIHRGTIKSIGETLLQRRYSKQAVNIVLAAADGFVVWSGHPEFQAVARYAQDDLPQPELTRTEYQRLLMAAKRLNREREYLLIKTIVLTGSNLPELMALTAEDVKKDLEGLQIMRNLARNMAFLIRAIADAKEKYDLPTPENSVFTSFPDGK